MKRFNDRGSERGFRGGGDRGGFRGPRRDFGPREMHQAVCSDCGQECEVPFKPTEGKPVYCKECYSKRRRSSY
ncbi:MAG: CxxC-x17-CxxC domain-containing protein [Nanoarchaeota archaeon]